MRARRGARGAGPARRRRDHPQRAGAVGRAALGRKARPARGAGGRRRHRARRRERAAAAAARAGPCADRPREQRGARARHPREPRRGAGGGGGRTGPGDRRAARGHAGPLRVRRGGGERRVPGGGSLRLRGGELGRPDAGPDGAGAGGAALPAVQRRRGAEYLPLALLGRGPALPLEPSLLRLRLRGRPGRRSVGRPPGGDPDRGPRPRPAAAAARRRPARPAHRPARRVARVRDPRPPDRTPSVGCPRRPPRRHDRDPERGAGPPARGLSPSGSERMTPLTLTRRPSRSRLAVRRVSPAARGGAQASSGARLGGPALLFAFSLAAVGAGAGRALTTTYLPVLLERINDAPSLIGAVMTVNALAGFAVPIAVGVWSDRRGRRPRRAPRRSPGWWARSWPWRSAAR